MSELRSNTEDITATVEEFYLAAEKIVEGKNFGLRHTKHMTIVGLVQAMATLAASGDMKNEK